MIVKLRIRHSQVAALFAAIEGEDNLYKRTPRESDSSTKKPFVSIKSVRASETSRQSAPGIPLCDVVLEVEEWYHPEGDHATLPTPLEKFARVLQAMDLFPEQDSIPADS